ncbi:hypothetical protein [Salinibacter ruber]|uniref:hypothetical protein n=1 Tax=Salinibacter ruber TaxID=146919 RepID=UPI00216A88D0|nr:hypothetical protein [Salinibacter ruber]
MSEHVRGLNRTFVVLKALKAQRCVGRLGRLNRTVVVLKVLGEYAPRLLAGVLESYLYGVESSL